jgi:hypothetical protein
MLNKLEGEFNLFINSNKKNDLFCSQKLTDFPIEAVNMLDFLTMFIHFGDLPIKVSNSLDSIIEILYFHRFLNNVYPLISVMNSVRFKNSMIIFNS